MVHNCNPDTPADKREKGKGRYSGAIYNSILLQVRLRQESQVQFFTFVITTLLQVKWDKAWGSGAHL